MLRLPLPITRADSAKIKLKDSSKKLRSTKTKTTRSGNKSKPKTDWKAIVSTSNTLSMMRNSRTRSMRVKNLQF